MEDYDFITEFGMDDDNKFYIEIDEEKTITIDTTSSEETKLEVFQCGEKIKEQVYNVNKQHKYDLDI